LAGVGGRKFPRFYPAPPASLAPRHGRIEVFFWNPRCCSTVVHTPADPAGRNL
jgi:hypothetical protein